MKSTLLHLYIQFLCEGCGYGLLVITYDFMILKARNGVEVALVKTKFSVVCQRLFDEIPWVAVVRSERGEGALHPEEVVIQAVGGLLGHVFQGNGITHKEAGNL